MADARTDKSRPLYIVFLTDGDPNSGREGINEANTLKGAGYNAEIYVIGFNTQSYSALAAVASKPASQYVFDDVAPMDLVPIMTEVAGAIKIAGTSATVVDMVKDLYFTAPADTSAITASRGTVSIQADKSIKWELGDILTTPATLTFTIDYKGTVSDDDLYPTNEGNAVLEYTNFRGNACKQTVESPVLTRLNGYVGVEYYLVNDAGQPINNEGTAVSFADRITLGVQYLDSASALVDDLIRLEPGSYTATAPATRTFSGVNYDYVAASKDNGGTASPYAVTLAGAESYQAYFGYKLAPKTYTVQYAFNAPAPAGVAAPIDDSSPYLAGADVTIDTTIGDTTDSDGVNWKFGGWKYYLYGTDGSQNITAATIAMPAYNINIYGGWTRDYKVSYSYVNAPEGADSLPADARYFPTDSVDVADAPADVVIGHTTYRFLGWTRDNAAATDFAMPASDVAIVGSWDNGTLDSEYPVTYKYTGTVPAGVPDAPSDSDSPYFEGASVTVKETPDSYYDSISHKTYTFDGWYYGGSKVTGTFEMPAEAVELTGSWDSGVLDSQYPVTYEYTGTVPGTAPTEPTDSKLYFEGEKVLVDTTITDYYDSAANMNYTFDGWYYGGEKVTELNMPVGGAKLTGSWSCEDGETYEINYYNSYGMPEEFDAYMPDKQTGLVAGKVYALSSPTQNIAADDSGNLWRFDHWDVGERAQAMSVDARPLDSDIVIDSNGNITMPAFDVDAYAVWTPVEGETYSVDVQHRYYNNGRLVPSYNRDFADQPVTASTKLKELFRTRTNYAFRDASISWKLAGAADAEIAEMIEKLNKDIAVNDARIAELLKAYDSAYEDSNREDTLDSLEQRLFNYEHIRSTYPGLIEDYEDSIAAAKTADEDAVEKIENLTKAIGELDSQIVAAETALNAMDSTDSGYVDLAEELEDLKAQREARETELAAITRVPADELDEYLKKCAEERDKLQAALNDANANYFPLKTLMDNVNLLGKENTDKQAEIAALEAQQAAGQKTLGRNDTFAFEDGYKYTITINYRRVSSPHPDPDPDPITIDDEPVPLANNPVTGDSTVVGLAAALAACSAITMAAVSLKKKKK